MIASGKSGYYGVCILRTFFGAACLLLAANHFIEGAPALEAFGVQLHRIGLQAPSPLFWGVLTPVLEVLFSVLVLFGKAFRTACALMLVPLFFEGAAVFTTALPKDLLFLIVLMGGYLGLSFIGTKKVASETDN